jgi:hypothetical protein
VALNNKKEYKYSMVLKGRNGRSHGSLKYMTHLGNIQSECECNMAHQSVNQDKYQNLGQEKNLEQEE